MDGIRQEPLHDIDPGNIPCISGRPQGRFDADCIPAPGLRLLKEDATVGANLKKPDALWRNEGLDILQAAPIRLSPRRNIIQIFRIHNVFVGFFQ